VAAAHFALRAAYDLHPWLGGGFGMFSTVDERRLFAWRVEAGGLRRLELPNDLDDAAERAEALPSEARLRAIADSLVAREPGGGAVRVEVWEARFGPSMAPELHRLRSVERSGAPRGQ
jgi:hypothetical protein